MHAETGRVDCVNLLGRKAKARPTEAYEAAVAAGYASVAEHRRARRSEAAEIAAVIDPEAHAVPGAGGEYPIQVPLEVARRLRAFLVEHGWEPMPAKPAGRRKR